MASLRRSNSGPQVSALGHFLPYAPPAAIQRHDRCGQKADAAARTCRLLTRADPAQRLCR
jgi:hypothetical protein